MLVVEDDDDARNILVSLLTYSGAFVSATATAAAALDIMSQVRADVVICDVNLSDHDALWLIAEVRRQPGDPPPFIAVSSQDYDEVEMQQAGFLTSLVKPVRHDLMVSRILAAVGR